MDSAVIVVASAFLLAGLVKGTIGMGLPTVVIGLLVLVIPPADVAALLVVPSLVTNVWQMWNGPALAPLSRRLVTLLAAIFIGTLAGASMLAAEGNAAFVSLATGLVLMAYSTLTLSGLQFAVSAALERWLSPIAGLMTGIVTGATGLFVFPLVPYLQSLDLHRDELVQALGIAFTVSSIALAAGLTVAGVFRPSIAAASVLAVVPTLLGVVAGQQVRSRLGAEAFRRIFLVGLLMLGTHLVLRAWL